LYTTGHAYVFKDQQLSTDIEMDANCPMCNSVDKILARTLLWPESTSTTEQRTKQELSGEVYDWSTSTADKDTINTNVEADNDENKGARPKTVSSAKRWTLKNVQSGVKRNNRQHPCPQEGSQPFYQMEDEQRRSQNTSWRNQNDAYRPASGEFKSDRQLNWRDNKQQDNNMSTGNSGWRRETPSGSRSARQNPFRNSEGDGKKMYHDQDMKKGNDRFRINSDPPFHRADPAIHKARWASEESEK